MKHVKAHTVKSFPIDEVLSVAFAAYRVNGNTYVKETNRFSEGKTPVWANKELVSYTLGHLENLKYPGKVLHYWAPEGFVPVEVTDEDIANIDVAKNHVKKYLIGAMSNKLTEFQQSIFDAVGVDQVAATKVALLSYLPEMIKREIADAAYIRKIKSEYADSAHIAENTFAGTIEVLKVLYLRDHDTHIVTAGKDGNLLSFFSKTAIEVGKPIKITAKVHKREVCTITKLPKSLLNYVKIKKS